MGDSVLIWVRACGGINGDDDRRSSMGDVVAIGGGEEVSKGFGVSSMDGTLGAMVGGAVGSSLRVIA
jgi:hypothetical protein